METDASNLFQIVFKNRKTTNIYISKRLNYFRRKGKYYYYAATLCNINLHGIVEVTQTRWDLKSGMLKMSPTSNL